MPEFLAKQRGLKHREFLQDLARLERAVSEAFDAGRSPASRTSRCRPCPLRTRFARASWGWRRCAPGGPLRGERVSREREGRSHDHAAPQERWPGGGLPPELRVYRLDLSKPAFALLRDLEAGRELSWALRAASRRGGRPPGEDQLFPLVPRVGERGMCAHRIAPRRLAVCFAGVRPVARSVRVSVTNGFSRNGTASGIDPTTTTSPSGGRGGEQPDVAHAGPVLESSLDRHLTLRHEDTGVVPGHEREGEPTRQSRARPIRFSPSTSQARQTAAQAQGARRSRVTAAARSSAALLGEGVAEPLDGADVVGGTGPFPMADGLR